MYGALASHTLALCGDSDVHFSRIQPSDPSSLSRRLLIGVKKSPLNYPVSSFAEGKPTPGTRSGEQKTAPPPRTSRMESTASPRGPHDESSVVFGSKESHWSFMLVLYLTMHHQIRYLPSLPWSIRQRVSLIVCRGVLFSSCLRGYLNGFRSIGCFHHFLWHLTLKRDTKSTADNLCIEIENRFSYTCSWETLETETDLFQQTKKVMYQTQTSVPPHEPGSGTLCVFLLICANTVAALISQWGWANSFGKHKHLGSTRLSL